VPATLIFFESPRRLADALTAMAEVFGDRPAAVGRELTKTFEEMRTGRLAALAAHYNEASTPKGEIVVCVGPPNEAEAADPDDVDRLLLSLAAEMPASKAAAEAARLTGGQKPALYRRLLELKDAG
jgi:16S rRNA (cytidine1402-2'-O)-methyltransferase